MPTAWELAYKGDDPLWEAYKERVRTGTLMGYELQRLEGGRDPATGRKMGREEAIRSDWEDVRRVARQRKMWKTLRRMGEIEVSLPPQDLPWPLPGAQLPDTQLPGAQLPGAQPLPSPGVEPGFQVPPLIQQWLGMMGKELPKWPTAPPMPSPSEPEVQPRVPPFLQPPEEEPRARFGTPPFTPVPQFAQPFVAPMAGLQPEEEPIPPAPMPEGLGRLSGMAGEVPTPTQEPPSGAGYGWIPPSWSEWLRERIRRRPGGWITVGPPGPVSPEIEARRERFEALTASGAQAVRKGHKWIGENIPGVSLVERGASGGLNWLLDKAMETVSKPSEWFEMLMGHIEMAVPAPTEEDLAAFLEDVNRQQPRGKEMIPFPKEVAGAMTETLRQKREFEDWLGTLEDPVMNWRLRWETSRIHWSGPIPRLEASKEIYDLLQEAKETGEPVTDEQITEILKDHENFAMESLGRIIFDPLLIDMLVGAPIGKAVFGVATMPFRGLKAGARTVGAGAAFAERLVSESKFARYMTEHYPVASKLFANTVKYVPRKMRSGVDWMRREMAISIARKAGLDTKDVAAALVTGRADDTIAAARRALEAMPGDELATRFAEVIETGKTGSPVHNAILGRVTEAIGGADEWPRIMKSAFRGQPLAELSGAEVATLLDQAATRAAMKAMGVSLKTDPVRRGVGWLRRLWVEQVLFSRPAWAVVNYTTNVAYGTFEGYDMFGSLDDITKMAIARRGGIAPVRLAETSVITEEMVEKALGASKLATAEIPGVGDLVSKLPAWVAKHWSSSEQSARLRIWAQASDARWIEEFAKIAPAIPENLPPALAEHFTNIWEHTSSPEQFSKLVGAELEALRTGVPRLDLVHYPNPLPGGYPYATVSDDVTRQLDGLVTRGRLTENSVDDVFRGAQSTLDDEYANRLAEIVSRSDPDAMLKAEYTSELETYLPAWDALDPQDQIEWRRIANERMVARSSAYYEYDFTKTSVSVASQGNPRIQGRIAEVHSRLQSEHAQLYGGTRKEWNKLVDLYDRGILTREQYYAETDKLWGGFNEAFHTLYGQAIEDAAEVGRALGPLPKVATDMMGRTLGTGHDITSDLGRAFNTRFPGEYGTVFQQTDWHWMVRIESPTSNRGIVLQFPKGPIAGVELDRLIFPYSPAQGTMDDMMKGISANNWEMQIHTLRNQHGLAEQELDKWQTYAIAQIQAPAEPAKATAQHIATLEDWYNARYAQLAEAARVADGHGQKEAARILFDYLTTTNFDNVMRHIFPFWKWPSHNIPFLAQLAIKKPWFVGSYARYRDISDYYVEKYNATERMRGYVPLPGSKEAFGTTIWINLAQLPMQSINQMFRPERSYEQDDPFGAQLLDYMGRLGFTPGPWITGTRVGRQFIPGAMQAGAKGLELLGAEGAGEMAPRGEDVFQIIPHISLLGYPAERFLDMDLGWEPPWHPYLVRRKISEWTTEGRISPATGEPITEQEAKAAQYDPSNELYQLADADTRQQLWMQSAVGFLFGYYPKMLSPGEEELRKATREYGEAPAFREDLRRIILDNHWYLRTYWHAFGPDEDVARRYAEAWMEEGRNYPGTHRLITEQDIERAIQNLEDPLGMSLKQQAVRDMGERERRLEELQEPFATDLAEITPANTKAYEDRIRQFFADRDAINAEYPLLDEEWGTPGFLERPVTFLVNRLNKLGDGLFDETGEPTTDDAPRIYAEKAQAFRQWLEMTAPMFQVVFGYNLVDEFDIRKARYEDTTQAAYNAFERLYLRPGATHLFGEELSDEESAEVERLINEARNNKAVLMAEIARVHPDWTAEEIAATSEVDLPDFDTWMRRNDSLRNALISMIWGQWMAEDENGNRVIVPKEALASIQNDLGDNIRLIFERDFLDKETRDYNSLSTRDLIVINAFLGGAVKLTEEGFEWRYEEGAVEGLPEDLGVIKEVERLDVARAQDYADYKRWIGYVMDWAEQDPEAAWGWVDENPDIQALLDRWTAGRKPSAKSNWWDWYWGTVPPGGVTKELRNIPVIKMVLDRGIREHLKDSAYNEALKAGQEWMAQHPEATVGNPEEWETVREVLDYIWKTVDATLGARDESGELTDEGWRVYWELREGYNWILDKYYPPKTGGRPPGKAMLWPGDGGEPSPIPGHPPTQPPIATGNVTPEMLEQEARAREGYQDLLSPVEAEEFKKWVSAQAGFTAEAQQELEKVKLQVNRSVGGGGGWLTSSWSIHLGAPSLEAAIHEYAHAYWEVRRNEQGDDLIEAVKRLAEESGPQYQRAARLADVYIRGEPLWRTTRTGFPGMRLSESILSPSVWGYGPDDVWNDQEMFAGLASGIMGDLEQLPPYIRKFYEGLFAGGAEEREATDYADIWPAMAIRGVGEGTTRPSRGGGGQLTSWKEFEKVAGPEIVGDLEAYWRDKKPLTPTALDYLFALRRQVRIAHFGAGEAKSFEEWLADLRHLKEGMDF